MKIQIDTHLTQKEVFTLLLRFDEVFIEPLHESVDFADYSSKLSQLAHFVLVHDQDVLIGFIAYYLNDEGEFAYISLTAILPEWQHKGIGHLMFTSLYDYIGGKYSFLNLEVLKTNINARGFYKKEGFIMSEDRNEKLLMSKKLMDGIE
ncbi:MAG: GNAT family N-acetyltransferase [Bacteroidales bacterium]|nr:GNAT family N-acetyltransferase [Bacteroidales bacterium]